MKCCTFSNELMMFLIPFREIDRLEFLSEEEVEDFWTVNETALYPVMQLISESTDCIYRI